MAVSTAIIDKCYDLVDGGAMVDEEHISEAILLHKAIESMGEGSKNRFYAELIKLEEEGFDDQ
jgi:hypothetical protein|tara:strand:- start:1416 stop:1604 length:189 start_codon:yes stop_codon:yes gene_type:complete